MSDTKYKINQEFIIDKAEDSIVIFNSEKSILHTLNETATAIFIFIEKGKSPKKISQILKVKFNVELETAERDVNLLIRQLLKEHIIIEK